MFQKLKNVVPVIFPQPDESEYTERDVKAVLAWWCFFVLLLFFASIYTGIILFPPLVPFSNNKIAN